MERAYAPYRPYRPPSPDSEEEDDDSYYSSSESYLTDSDDTASTETSVDKLPDPKILQTTPLMLATFRPTGSYNPSFAYETFEDAASAATGATGAASAPTGPAPADLGPLTTSGQTDQVNQFTKLRTTTTQQTSLISITSADRDHAVFPQPTDFTLYLPKIYRNVTTFQFTQIKLLSAFFYFRNQKYNTWFDVHEEGRTTLAGAPLINRVQIHEGSYDINGLLGELTIQMNTTPTFFYYPGGFADFVPLFSTTGDLAYNFNKPGDYYFDAALQKYIPNPTLNYIITRYFPARYGGLTSYTLNEMLVAYYYPVLKEAFLDPVDTATLGLNITVAGLTEAQVYDRVVYNYGGLSDPVILQLVNQNLAVLDSYRNAHTFLTHLVNRYIWGVDTMTNKVYVTSSNLNTSIVADITAQQQLALSNTLCNDYGYSQQQYLALSNALQADASLINSLVNYYQVGLANYYGVNYGSYSLEQLVQPSTLIYLQNGSNAGGVYNAYTLDYIQAKGSGAIKDLPDFNATPSTLITNWSTLVGTTPTFDLSTLNLADRGVPYEYSLSNFIETGEITDASGILYTNPKLQSASYLAPISSGQYTLFRFRSDVRQTLQVETLPKPFFYRYPRYMYAFGNNLPTHFNKDYTWAPAPAQLSNAGQTINDFGVVPFGLDMVSSAVQHFSTAYFLQSSNNTFFYKFTAPAPSTLVAGAQTYKYDMNIGLFVSTFSTFTTPVRVTLYHDDAGFYADTRPTVQENEYNYVSSITTSISSATGTVSWPVIAGQSYYVTVRTLTTSFGDMPFYFVAYTGGANVPVVPLEDPAIPITEANNPAFFDPVANLLSNPQNINFNKTNDPAWTHLNTATPLFLRDPTFQGFTTALTAAAPVIGYDDSNVSTDFTDYKGWIPGVYPNAPWTQYRKDPLNGVQLISNTPYSPTAQSYFFAGSSNSLQAADSTPYTPYFSTVQKREYKIVNWYDDTYIAPQTFDAVRTISSMQSISTRIPYNQSTLNVGGYTYAADSNFGGLSTLQLGYGVSGVGFLPTDGAWDCDRFMFKSAYAGAASPNADIAYVGVFDTLSIKRRDKTAISLADAVAILSSSRTAVYSTFTQVGAATAGGFDPSLGSYYEFTRLPWESWPAAYRRHDKAAAGLAGYTQLPCTIITREESYYSVLPFKADGTLTTFYMMCGSTVPYPDNSAPVPSTSWLGYGVPTDDGPREAVVPVQTVSTLSNYCSNIYEARYERSLPIHGQIIHYQGDLDIVDQANGMKRYSPWHGLVNENTYELKSGNYNEGSNRFLAYGPSVLNFGAAASNYYSIVSTPRYCAAGDIYLVRNAGEPGRDSVFVNHFDMGPLAPAGEVAVQWATTSNTPYLLTVSTTDTTLKLYEITGSLSNLTYGLGGLVTSFKPYVSTASYTDFLHVSSPNFGITRDSNFWYTDLAAGQSSMRGVLVHNLSSGTSLYGGFFVSSATYFETTANVAETAHHTLLTDAAAGSTKILEGDFTVSGAALDVGTGMYLGTLTLSNLLTDPFYGSQLFSVRSDSVGNCFLLSSNYTDRWVAVYKDPAVLPVGSNLDVKITANAPTFFNPAQAFSNVSWTIGDDDSYWIKVTQDSYYSQEPWIVYGNTRVKDDLGYGLETAWQIFYPAMKITLTKRTNSYNDITNTVDTNYFSNFGGFYSNPPNYPEYGRTQMFFYSNYDSLMRDMSTVSASVTLYKWGQESNYTNADTEFQGYYFGSYIYNIGLQPAGPIVDSNSYSYLAIRGYSPTEDFQTMVRFRLTNRYDYGFVSANDLFSEIAAVNTGNVSNYNPEYVASTSNFDRYFSTNTIALGLTLNPALVFTGFQSYHSTIQGYYGRYTSNLAIFSSIQTTVVDTVGAYLQKYYGDLLPSTYFARAKFTDPIRFQLLFKSSIYPPLSNVDQFWGLGYNLGFPKADMSNNTPATADGRTPIVGSGTYYNAESFYKILDDYIYLRLNDEYSLNRVDTSGPEDLARTTEPTGATKQYYAKLLLGNFGTYTQTMIQNPVALNPPIAKLDRVRFQWVDALGTVIDNADCEWSGILQIAESVDVAIGDATIERPPPVA